MPTPEEVIAHLKSMSNEKCHEAAALIASLLRDARQKLSDDEVMRIVINGCDTLDITRVSEMKPDGWHATTIFDGDAALLRVVKSAIDAAIRALPNEKEGK